MSKLSRGRPGALIVAVVATFVLAKAPALAQSGTPAPTGSAPSTVGSAAPSSQPPWVMLPATPPGSPPPASSSQKGLAEPDPAALPAPETVPPAPPPGYGAPGYAPPGYPPPYPPPYWDYGPPPPTYVPPSQRPGWHYRDGFYFRMGFGVAQLSSKLTYPVLNTSTGAYTGGNDRLSGTGVAVDAAIGGTLAPGFVLAADLGGHDVGNVSRRASGDTYIPQAMSYSRLGVMTDIFPNPRAGWHVQGGVGFASVSIASDRSFTGGRSEASYPDRLSGIGGNLGAGWEAWVGPDWSIGVLFRVDWASLRQQVDGGTARMTLVTPSVLFALTLNLRASRGQPSGAPWIVVPQPARERCRRVGSPPQKRRGSAPKALPPSPPATTPEE